jgi:hypothetical protein
MSSIGISFHWRQEVVFTLSALFLIALCLVSGWREKISTRYYCFAIKHEEIELGNRVCKGKDSWFDIFRVLFLKVISNSDPEANLKVAIALNPSNADALFQLGWLYEQRQDGHILASNRLAVLQLVENSDKSVNQASITLLVATDPRKFDIWNKSSEETKRTWRILYAWALYFQDREKQASKQLDLANNFIPNREQSEIHTCVLAAIEQTSYDKGGKSKPRKESLVAKWETCQKNKKRAQIEGNFWMNQATECLRNIDSEKPCLSLKRRNSRLEEKPDSANK